MKRIYTRTGDEGMTAIHGGERVSKTDIRIEANGCLDELNVDIGVVRAFMQAGHKWQSRLKDIQHTMMSLMSLVATPEARRHVNPNSLPETLVTDIESFIDEVTGECPEAEYFILPGGTPLSALMHRARVSARRAERRLWSLNEADPVPEQILMYVNRLSDLFFIMARHVMMQAGRDEEIWKAFAYKRALKSTL